MEQNILIPLLLTLGAGLATGIGSAIAFFARRTNKRLLSFSLGLSGGVMVYVSFVELFQQANATLAAEWGSHAGGAVTVAAFFAGILLIGIIDRLVPSVENPHEAHSVEEMEARPRNTKLMRMGLLTALAIGIHNFPEGIATFASAVDDVTLGAAIAVRSPSTTSPRASPSRCRSTTPRATAAGPSCCRCSRASPSPWGRCSPTSCSCPS